jgi:hypothetical protein
MRTRNLSTVFYNPGVAPSNADDMRRFVGDELIKIQIAITALADGHLDETHVTPDKPRDGDIRFADGTNFNPGLGQGVYCYYNTTWNKLG